MLSRAPRLASVLVFTLFACDRGPASSAADPRPSVPADSTQPTRMGLLGDLSSEPVNTGAEPLPVGAPAKPAPEPVWRRYVALVDKPVADACPTASAGWTGGPLFRSGQTAALLADKTLPVALERFCVYTWGGKGAPAAAPAFSGPDASRVVRIDADREVVVPQAGYLGGDPNVRGALADAFLQAAGARPSGVTGSSVHDGPEGPARVAIVDTAGHADAALAYKDAAPRQRHGLTMAEVIAALRCPNNETGCRGQQYFAQAFPYDGASPLPQPAGGQLGSLGSLAHAIGEALVRWRSQTPGNTLVLNLSLGWDPRHGGALTPAGQEATHTDLLVTPSAGVPATVQAVHAAMVYAACLQALPIAAAGNNPGAACEQSGLMAPASWERYPAPDQARCAALFGPLLPQWRTGAPGIAAPTRALVYGAGGVDASHRPIPIARRGGTPRRVLAALQAVAGAGAQQTDAWTGTSIAAASLSALAAQVWSHYPALSPEQVIALLDASGTPTSLPVDGAPQKTRARRLHAHGAFAHLCTVRYAGVPCPNPYREPTMPAPMSWPAALTAASTTPAQVLPCATSTVSCGGVQLSRRMCGQSPTAPVLATGEPWVRPQPQIPICPVCPIRGGRLTLSLSPEYAGQIASLQEPVLEFSRADGSSIGVRLPALQIDAAGTEVDLSRFTVDVGAGPADLAAVIASEGLAAGVLGFTVLDAAGSPVWLSSVVTVEP